MNAQDILIAIVLGIFIFGGVYFLAISNKLDKENKKNEK